MYPMGYAFYFPSWAFLVGGACYATCTNCFRGYIRCNKQNFCVNTGDLRMMLSFIAAFYQTAWELISLCMHGGLTQLVAFVDPRPFAIDHIIVGGGRHGYFGVGKEQQNQGKKIADDTGKDQQEPRQ